MQELRNAPGVTPNGTRIVPAAWFQRELGIVLPNANDFEDAELYREAVLLTLNEILQSRRLEQIIEKDCSASALLLRTLRNLCMACDKVRAARHAQTWCG
jgi:hypothetical protein